MDGLREQLLARSRLAGKQDRGRASSRDVGKVQSRAQALARPEDGLEGEMRVRSGHLHRHAHHFLLFHDREQTATSSPLFMRIGSRDAKCVVPLRRARISRARNPFPSLRYPVML